MRTTTAILICAVSAGAVNAQAVWTLRTAPVPTGTILYRPAGKPGFYLIPTDDRNGPEWQYYLRSTDGVIWSRVLLPAADHSESDSLGNPALVCANNRFVGIYPTNSIWTTDDGIASHEAYRASVDPFRPTGIAYGNSIWLILLDDGRVLRSTDNAATWQEYQTPAASLRQLVFGAGKFVAGTDAATLQSQDGITWTIGPRVPDNGDAAFDAGRFLASAYSSVDAITWTLVTGSDSRPTGGAIRSGGGQFLIWANTEPTPKFWTSTTGPWSGPFSAPVIDSITDVSFCGDLWIAVTKGRKVLTSPVPVHPAPVAPALSIAPALRLSWQSAAGRSYLIQRSVNQTAWSDYTGIMLGTGGIMEWLAPASANKEFFRVKVQ